MDTESTVNARGATSEIRASPAPRWQVDLRVWSLFVASVAMMAVHKAECWYTEEWLNSPFFIDLIALGPYLGDTPDHALGEAMFLVFVTWLFVGLVMGACVLWGGGAARVALGIWGLTFVLEFHHPVRAISHGGYYPGVVSAVGYLALGPAYWWALLRPRSPL